MELNIKKVQISVNFNEFKSLKIDNSEIFVFNFQEAINIVRFRKLLNVRLRQESKSSVIEWDNF